MSADALAIAGLIQALPGRDLRLEDWRVPAGRAGLVLGPSGCGKTTLFHLIAGLLTPQAGQIRVAGADIAAMPGRQRDSWRARQIGFAPQEPRPIDALSLRDNLLLAQRFCGRRDAAEADRLLAAVGLGERAGARPTQLSRGERQRLAVARALVNRPALLLADEPTAALDDANAAAVADLLMAQAAAAGAALVIATHDHRLKSRLPVLLELAP